MRQLFAIILSLALLLAVGCKAAEESPAQPVQNDAESVTSAPQKEEASPAETPQSSPMEPDPEPIAEPDIDLLPELERLTGYWYGELQGMILRLTLNEDGTYQAVVLGREESGKTGTWMLMEGFIYLDGEEEPEISVFGEDLKWTDGDMFLRREMPATFTPAELMENVPPEYYTGYWKAEYMSVDGSLFAADLLGEAMGAYIEGTNVALTGPLTGKTVLETVYEENGLVWTDGDVSVSIRMQQDGFLRLTLETGEETVTAFLAPALIWNEDAAEYTP